MITATFHEDCFSDKVALITGGTSGTGAAIGNALAELGANVTVTGATASEAEDAAKRESFWVERSIALDVRDEAAIFLCSPAASFVTRSIIAVDGGYMAG